MASIINASTSGAGGVITTADASGVLNIQTASTTAMTINASQNVGIGTASPASKLDVNGSVYIGAYNYFTAATGGYWASGNNAFTTGWYENGGSLYFRTSGNNNAQIDSSANFYFNSGYGSAARAYGCRAWVNFNGTGTVAIRASGNVTSITDNGTGDYTVNFTTAMPDTNYAGLVTGALSGANIIAHGTANGTVKTTSSYRIQFQNAANTLLDVTEADVAIFR